jgi:DME family drug/metabolite transporter
MAAYQLCFFAAVLKTGVAVGTLVAIGSAPILAGLLAFLGRGERPGFRWLVATVLAVLGCSLLISASGGVSVDIWGVMLALGAGCAYAAFTTASKGLLQKQPAHIVMAVVFCLGALFLSPLLFRAEVGWLVDPRGLGVALHLGLIATAAAYTLFGHGLATVPVATAVTLSLAEPLTAGLLGVLVLGERLTPGAWLGLGLLFSGLAVLSVAPQQVKPAAGQYTGPEDG